MVIDPIFARVDSYVAGLFAEEDDALRAAVAAMSEAGMPAISVSATEGRLLQILAHTCGARRILEIGTLGGYSTIWTARGLPADGRLVTIELDPKHAEVARANLARAGVGDRVTVRVGKALDELPRIEAEGLGPFDMVFLDADKKPYAEHLDGAVRLSRPGTVIVADNVVRDGKVLDPDSPDEFVQGVRRFNAALAARTDVDGVVFQTVARGHDGMAIGVVR